MVRNGVDPVTSRRLLGASLVCNQSSEDENSGNNEFRMQHLNTVRLSFERVASRCFGFTGHAKGTKLRGELIDVPSGNMAFVTHPALGRRDYGVSMISPYLRCLRSDTYVSSLQASNPTTPHPSGACSRQDSMSLTQCAIGKGTCTTRGGELEGGVCPGPPV